MDFQLNILGFCVIGNMFKGLQENVSRYAIYFNWVGSHPFQVNIQISVDMPFTKSLLVQIPILILESKVPKKVTFNQVYK